MIKGGGLNLSNAKSAFDDGFIMFFDQNLDDMVTSGTNTNQGAYFGGTLNDWIYDLKFHPTLNCVFICGITNSNSLPSNNGLGTPNFNGSFKKKGSGFIDAFVARLSYTFNGTSTDYSAYIGNTNNTIGGDFGTGLLITDEFVYLVGQTIGFSASTTNFMPPITNTNNLIIGNTGADIFVAKICQNPDNPGSISGDAFICIGNSNISKTYSIPSVPWATGYNWRLLPYIPSSLISLQINGNEVTLSINKDFSGSFNLIVEPFNGCGTSNVSSSVSINVTQYVIKIYPVQVPCIDDNPVSLYYDQNLSNLNLHPDFPNISFHWEKDGQTLSSQPATILLPLQVNSPGKYKLVSVDACNNVISSEEVTVHQSGGPNFDNSYANGYTFSPDPNIVDNPTYYTLDNTNYNGYVMGGTITVQGSVILTISNVDLEMLNCAKIKIEQGGGLILENVNIYSCSHWYGIVLDGGTLSTSSGNTASSIANADCAVEAEGDCSLQNVTFLNNIMHIYQYVIGTGVSLPGFTVNNCIFKPTSDKFTNCNHPTLNKDAMILVEGTIAPSIDHCLFEGDYLNNNRFSEQALVITNGYNVIFTNSTLNGSFYKGINITGIDQYSIGQAFIGVNNYSLDNHLGIANDGNLFNGYFHEYALDIKSNISILNYPVILQSIAGNTFWMTNTSCKAIRVQDNYHQSLIEGNSIQNASTGLELYQYATLNNTSTRDQVWVSKNHFENCTNALVISPTVNPIANSQTQSSHQQDIQVFCNKFINNTRAIVGSGFIIDQKDAPVNSSGEEWNNTFLGNGDWDIIWQGSSAINVYNGSNQMSAPLLNQQPVAGNVNLNGTSVGKSNISSYITEYLASTSSCRGSWKRSPIPMPLDTVIKNQIVKQFSGSGLNIYPNPFNASFKLSTVSPITNATLHIIDLLGREVYTESIPYLASSMSVNTASLPKGVYFVVVDTKGQFTPYRIKLMKE